MAQIDAQDYLRLVEGARKLAVWDTESAGFNGDYGSILVVSVKTYGEKETVSFPISQVGNDQRVVREARDYLNSFDCWVTYYGKGHDVPLLNTRLLKWKLQPLESRHHVDMFFTLKHKLRTGSKSQAHLLSWLETPEQKMTVSADVWSALNVNFKKNIRIIKERCVSDCEGLEALYDRTKHLIRDIKRA